VKTLGDKYSIPLRVFGHLHSSLWEALFTAYKNPTELSLLECLFEASEDNLGYYDQLFDRVLVPTL